MISAQTLESILEQYDSSTATPFVESPELTVAVKTFEPGEVFSNHYHNYYDEFFAAIAGTVTIWLDRSRRIDLAAGSTLLCTRNTQHYLVNDGATAARILVVKVPRVTSDVVWVDWSP